MPQLKLDVFTNPPREPLDTADGYVSHPRLKPNLVRHRVFQTEMARWCVGRNALVVLPTGLGKTIIALQVTVGTLDESRGRVLFVAPTRPLVQQHHDTFSDLMVEGQKLSMVSGSVPPEKRRRTYKDSDIIFATPQCVANDIENEIFPLGDLVLLIVDEAHRTVGDYSYVKICESVGCPVLGLTASPGGKKKRITEVLDHLRVDTVQARTRRDPDVARYVKDIKIEWVRVKLNEKMEEIRDLLDGYLVEKVSRLQKLGILSYKKAKTVSKTDILGARKLITTRFNRNKGVMFGAIHNQSLAVYAFHCIETLETQGVRQLRDYLERFGQEKKPSKSKRSFIKDERVQKVLALAKEYSGVSHPKLAALGEIIRAQVAEKPDSRIIVFTQLRDTISTIMEVIEESDATGARFVGQAKRADGEGLKQKEQKTILDDLRSKEFNVLVATSVAEEGLDIPDVDLVVFYEPLPSEIRNIQRRGRTGRSSIGRVKVLIAEDSRDEAYLWAGVAREKKMRGFISWMEAEGTELRKKRGR